MILGSMTSWQDHTTFEHRVIVEALEKLSSLLQQHPAEGRVEFDGDKLYASIMEFDVKSLTEQVAEKHEQYIDVHYLIEGEETIGWSSLQEDSTAVKPYDSEQDYALYEPSADELLIRLKPGMFAVFFPHDIHRPGMGEPARIKKAVIKIHVGLMQA
ncbi:YhcH/YjgK/YiaL family protein [Paenibacillus oenotherae]|uniref:YhcH/YjgK/YiaL family protein n=1 Tax=Paenibacillus oenotherae TaxID=1435645 RepID=A0ABS7DBD0_9BACL|nr:YhcH/YjgK/YiaL family protein [Paenibacillus oenotherae]MBW7477191.1 YhcH/YjgK/YiaL family protein [Paenibacillus oenotherae]